MREKNSNGDYCGDGGSKTCGGGINVTKETPRLGMETPAKVVVVEISVCFMLTICINVSHCKF